MLEQLAGNRERHHLGNHAPDDPLRYEKRRVGYARLAPASSDRDSRQHRAEEQRCRHAHPGEQGSRRCGAGQYENPLRGQSIHSGSIVPSAPSTAALAGDVRCDFPQRRHDKVALAIVRMWNLQLREIHDPLTVEEDIEVDDTGPPAIGGRPAQSGLQLFERLEQLDRFQLRADLDYRIEKARLVGGAPGRRVEKRRYADDRGVRQCPNRLDGVVEIALQILADIRPETNKDTLCVRVRVEDQHKFTVSRRLLVVKTSASRGTMTVCH
jgi:hypothetical protein